NRFSLKQELMMAVMPTLTVICVFLLVGAFSRQRLLFASLSSSAFLIYVDPEHGMNRVFTLTFSQMLAATLGLFAYLVFGPGYLSGGVAMITAITLMILFDVVHPPAVSTSLSFAFRTGEVDNYTLFGMAVAMIAVLVILEQAALRIMFRVKR
ncbi:MAG: HPP family protein, partial [Thermodesulfobacteriota bacterium]